MNQMEQEKPSQEQEGQPQLGPELPEEKQTTEQELKELLQRTQANFENYRKQMEKRMEEIKQMAGKDILMQLLPLIDQFQLALQSMNERTSPKDLMKGMELIYAQLNALLEQNNVQPIPTESVAFDPYYHEALMKVESHLPENTILEEFQKGYVLQGKVLRHARVKLSAGQKNKTENNTEVKS